MLVLLCGVRALAEDPLDAALKRLSSVGVFAFGGVGFAGRISKGEIDFNFVVSQSAPAAVAALEKLYATGNPQGKSYALSGIKKLDPMRFQEFLATLRTSGEEVEVMRGCIIYRQPLKEIASQIDRRQFRF